jgi:hypothetical protein
MMEAVRTSETLVYFNETTRRYTPEGYHLDTRRRENLKPHEGTFLVTQLLYEAPVTESHDFLHDTPL